MCRPRSEIRFKPEQCALGFHVTYFRRPSIYIFRDRAIKDWSLLAGEAASATSTLDCPQRQRHGIRDTNRSHRPSARGRTAIPGPRPALHVASRVRPAGHLRQQLARTTIPAGKSGPRLNAQFRMSPDSCGVVSDFTLDAEPNSPTCVEMRTLPPCACPGTLSVNMDELSSGPPSQISIFPFAQRIRFVHDEVCRHDDAGTR